MTAAPTLFTLLAEFERAPLLAPPRNPSKSAFHAARNRGWISPIVTFDSRRKRTTHWQITTAGRAALAEHRAQQRAA